MRALAENPESRAVFLALAHQGALKRARSREMVLALARLMHDRPVADEARRRINEIADAHEEDTREDLVRRAVRSYERAHHTRLRVDRLDAAIDRLAITDLKARLIAIQSDANARRLAVQLRRANARAARALLKPRTAPRSEAPR